MSSREKRLQIAQETVTILNEGRYLHPSGTRVTLGEELASARSRSVLYAPEQFPQVFRQREQRLRNHTGVPTTFEVVNETTLHAAQRLVKAEPGTRVLALNFASARHPGGGFLKGAQAQEESLARASGLYACLAQFPEMYAANDRLGSCLYTDHMNYAQ